MRSRIFILRPGLAAVLNIIITLAGIIGLMNLPVEEYPNIAPPSLFVSAGYTGASADVVEQTVGMPLEDGINGIDDLLYFSSTSSNDGSYSCSVTFRTGTDTDIALVNLQNALTGILHESFFPATHPGQPLPGGVFHMLRRLQVSNGRGMPQLSAPVLMAASRGDADFLCTLPVKHNDGPAQACRSSSASAHSLRSRLFEPVSRLRRAVLLV